MDKGKRIKEIAKKMNEDKRMIGRAKVTQEETSRSSFSLRLSLPCLFSPSPKQIRLLEEGTDCR
jgi:hypothetical protein